MRHVIWNVSNDTVWIINNCITRITSHLTCLFCVHLSLLIVMLLARNAWDSHLGCTPCGDFQQTFPQQDPMLWLDLPLWFILWLQDIPEQQPSGNFENTRFITHKSCKGTWHAWGHTVRSWEEKRRKIMQAWCSSFIKVEGGGLGFHRFTLYWWIFNTKAGIWSVGKEKQGH